MRYIRNADVTKKKKKEQYAENPERVRKNTAKWRAANPAARASYHAKRRAREVQAMPSWLTQDQILQIRAVYAEANLLSVKTGTLHHVDHVVPLNGKTVCGLHVPWNLRAITATKNLRRPKIYMEGMN
jgi:5-methylcytosine-specific restriction endonuclease McrA